MEGSPLGKQNKVTIKQLREELGLSQEKLAQALGVRRATISDYERGKQYPKGLEMGLRLGILLGRAGRNLDDLILALPDPDDYRAAETPGAYRTD
jgi:DNA-binding XRE family transcriptional regulator